MDIHNEPPLMLLQLIHEASKDDSICREVGIPSNMEFVAINDWLKSYQGLVWAVTSEKNKTPLALYLCKPELEFPAFGCEEYWQISPLVLEPFRGNGIIYHTIPFVHQELKARQIPGLAAFTWENDHSPTRLWRKLGYRFLGRVWAADETNRGWKLVWSRPLAQ